MLQARLWARMKMCLRLEGLFYGQEELTRQLDEDERQNAEASERLADVRLPCTSFGGANGC